MTLFAVCLQLAMRIAFIQQFVRNDNHFLPIRVSKFMYLNLLNCNFVLCIYYFVTYLDFMLF